MRPTWSSRSRGVVAAGLSLTAATALTGLTATSAGAHAKAKAAVYTTSGLVVSVGYAEDKETNNPDPASFPTPWAGAPNTTFLGNSVPGQSACGSLPTCYDTGAIRLDNPTGSPITVSRVTVDIHSSLSGGKVFDNLWGSFTVQPGQSVILAANPPFNNPGSDNFDTSGYPPNICTPVTVAPTVTLTIGGVATTLVDSTHVLDTNGYDMGYCHQNESIQWRHIGAAKAGAGRAAVTLDQSMPQVTAGTGTSVTATVLDGGGTGLANVTVGFRVIAGPDMGTTGTAVTDASGKAVFSYTPAGTGQDALIATVTTVGSFTSPPPISCPNPWTCQDIGAPALAGSQYFDPSTGPGGTWTIEAGGTDISGTADQFRFISQPLTGDTVLVAQIASQSVSSSNAKAGLMLRGSTDAGSPEYSVLVSPGAGIKVQKRSAQGATTSKLANPAGTAPIWLKITRTGDSLASYMSTDGVTWTLIAGSVTTLPLGASPLEGLAVTSHNATGEGTVTVDGVSVAP